MNHFAILNMKNGKQYFYRRDTTDLYLSLENDFKNKNNAYIGLHESLIDLVKQNQECFFSMSMESVDYIEYVGVVFIPGPEGQQTAVFTNN